MKYKIYTINQNQAGEEFGIMFFDGEEWKVKTPYKTYKTLKAVKKTIQKLENK